LFRKHSITADKISKYQYYSIVKQENTEQYFVFENSLGGLDTLRCTGEIRYVPEFNRETALMGDTEQTFFAEKKNIRTQNTGWLTKYDTAWLHDFFMSKKIWLLENDKLNPVVIDEITAETSSKENLRSFEFKFRPSEKSDYLIIYDRLTTYTSAEYVNPVCQQLNGIIIFLSAQYINPVCQQIEQTVTYTSAEYVNAVCQVVNQSVSYTLAEWINPVCQQEQASNNILLDIYLVKSAGQLNPQNQMTITWNMTYSGTLPNDIRVALNSNIRVRNNIGVFSIVNVNIDFVITSKTGLTTQLVDYYELVDFVNNGTTLTRISPDNIGGQPIIVSIILSR
jgi:hypothetical protein